MITLKFHCVLCCCDKHQSNFVEETVYLSFTLLGQNPALRKVGAATDSRKLKLT